MQSVQIHGAQRTGTNYLTLLLERNLRETEVSDEGKHGPANPRRDADGHVVIYKDPWAWVYSHRRLLYSGFWGKLEWKWRKAADRGWKPYQCARWLNHYVNLYLNWQRDLPETTAWIQYERLLDGLGPGLEEIARQTGIALDDEAPIDVKRRIDPGQEVTERTFDSSKYTERRYMQEFSERDIQRIYAASQEWGFLPRFSDLPFGLESPQDIRHLIRTA